MSRYLCAALVAGLFVTGCTGSKGPIIDTKGVDMTMYQQDLAECQTYAQEVSVGGGAAKGAAVGAAAGAAIGAIRGRNVGEDAGVGAVLGGTKSGTAAKREQEQVVKTCLRGRGYKVLN